MNQPKEEGDAADAVNFDKIDLNEIADSCPTCGKPLNSQGDCGNVDCEDSPWYDDGEDDDEDLDDEDDAN